MFNVKCKAEVRHLNVRKETHGDDLVLAVDVKLMLIGVPVADISSAVPDMGKRFYAGDVVAVGEVNPLTVQHKLENLEVVLGATTFKGVDIKKGMKINLQPAKYANLELSVQITDFSRKQLATFADMYLDDEITVQITERQLSVVGLE